MVVVGLSLHVPRFVAMIRIVWVVKEGASTAMGDHARQSRNLLYVLFRAEKIRIALPVRDLLPIRACRFEWGGFVCLMVVLLVLLPVGARMIAKIARLGGPRVLWVPKDRFVCHFSTVVRGLAKQTTIAKAVCWGRESVCMGGVLQKRLVLKHLIVRRAKCASNPFVSDNGHVASHWSVRVGGVAIWDFVHLLNTAGKPTCFVGALLDLSGDIVAFLMAYTIALADT